MCHVSYFICSYIYTDEADLSPDNVIPVLYLAKKYLLNNLVAQASKYVASRKNIVKVLPRLNLVDGQNAAR